MTDIFILLKMLDLLTLVLFTIFLIHFYLLKYKQYLWWHKLEEHEASVSEYHHLYTPSVSLPLQKKIESAHEMKAGHIIEIINYGQDEVMLDVFDENKQLLYHFYCPQKLLFSGQYNHTHLLETGKKYSFFITSIVPVCSFTFRQVPYYKIKAIERLSKESEIIYYQENYILNDYIEQFKNKYNVRKIYQADINNNWPNAGCTMTLNFVLKADNKALLLTTNKNCQQSIEIIQEHESYFLPVTEKKRIWTQLLECDQDTKISIIERCHNLLTSEIEKLTLIILD